MNCIYLQLSICIEHVCWSNGYFCRYIWQEKVPVTLQKKHIKAHLEILKRKKIKFMRNVTISIKWNVSSFKILITFYYSYTNLNFKRNYKIWSLLIIYYNHLFKWRQHLYRRILQIYSFYINDLMNMTVSKLVHCSFL